jgi:hypothetical protein
MSVDVLSRMEPLPHQKLVLGYFRIRLMISPLVSNHLDLLDLPEVLGNVVER